MNVTTVESSEEFLQLAGEWNELLDAGASRCIFLTHEWLHTWWKHCAGNRQLSIVIAREGPRLVGILPLTRRPPDLARMTPSALEFLGSGVIGSDYLDAIVHPEYREPVLNSFSGWIGDQAALLQLSQLRTGECHVESIAARLSDHSWTSVQVPINVCPFINLNGLTWESYLAGLGSSQRYNFQRRLRNLEKLPGFRFARAADGAEASEFLSTLIRLHDERWKSRGEASEAFQDEAFRAFHHDFVQLAARRGWLRLFNLSLDDRPVAALYGLRYGGTFSFYQSGFDPELAKQSVGLVVMGLAIQAAIEEAASEYDFLHGGEEYKFHWAKETRALSRLELFPGHARARVYRSAMTFNRAARRMAKRVLQSL